jgi:DMSO/TMAO reductase YedYZ molybdopterin-dependent catalytic subunit
MTLTRSFAILALVISLFSTAARAEEPSCPGGHSNQFRLNGQVQNPSRFRLVDLQYRPSSIVTVSFFSGSSGFVTRSYIGVPLIDLLNDAVIIVDNAAHRNDILRKYVVVRGTDCYEVIIAVADLLSNFGHQQVLVAFETGDGLPLDPSEGFARLIVVNDKQGGRLVSNVDLVTVRSAP